MDFIKIIESKHQLVVKNSCLDHSTFSCASLKRMNLVDVTLAGSKILDANLSGIEVDGAQLGGAYFRNIGVPPKGHPLYEPEAKQQPVKFENCDFGSSSFINCNLAGVELNNCNTKGMKINGILIEDLLARMI